MFGLESSALLMAAHTCSPLRRLNSSTTWCPNSHPAPRGEMAHVSISSGSDHTMSQKGPSWGTSRTRSMVHTWGHGGAG